MSAQPTTSTSTCKGAILGFWNVVPKSELSEFGGARTGRVVSEREGVPTRIYDRGRSWSLVVKGSNPTFSPTHVSGIMPSFKFAFWRYIMFDSRVSTLR